ncbi:hypothetical protein L226DRAFT_609355 [Lentinus tigrinus ALCF2SS1-7]|uniref:uncharacterized protein n=1 Tax=Lentinus tigrinus ALCF2SS1-7 TaxID=1328758 RepID=UPI001166146E|nr:hypothetical protein L226DRAFT_609355 [Lentinus tigrinus ALCF2SS1-7]
MNETLEHTSHEPCLPPELWDRVIDYLHDDKRVLKRTSLVCKAWRPSSQFHLFHDICYYSPEQWFHDIPPILQFVTTAPHLAAYVRDFTFRSGTCIVWELRDLLDTMPGLKKVCMESATPLGPLPPRSRATPISELEFQDCKLPLRSFLNILSLFTSIDHLALSYTLLFRERDPSEPRASVHTLSSLPAIRTISAVDISIEHLHDVVERTPVGNLDTLVVTSCIQTWGEVNLFRELLAALRPTLRRLDLSPHMIDGKPLEMMVRRRNWKPEQMWKRMDLEQCVSLETLNLFRYQARSDIGVVLQMYLAACKFAPPSLRTLYIRMQKLPKEPYSPPPGYDADGFWDDLDRTLLRARSDLAVTLELCDTAPNVEQFKAFVARHLPGAVDRGRLRLTEKILIGSSE